MISWSSSSSSDGGTTDERRAATVFGGDAAAAAAAAAGTTEAAGQLPICAGIRPTYKHTAKPSASGVEYDEGAVTSDH